MSGGPSPRVEVPRDLALSSILSDVEGVELVEGGRRLSRCPACSAPDGKKRTPVVTGHGGKSWRCYSCTETGDALDLLSWVLVGCRGREAGSRFAEVLTWLQERRALLLEAPPPPPPAPRVPESELRAALRLCRRPEAVPEVAAWLSGRGIEPARAPCGVLPPGFSAGWWPRSFSRWWPIVAPMVDGHGRVAGVHGATPYRSDLVQEQREGRHGAYVAHLRRPCPSGRLHAWEDGACGACGATRGRKTTWPRGTNNRGLLFADPGVARPWMTGSGPTPRSVLIAEGITDYLHAVAARPPGRPLAVLGVESGSAAALRLVSWPIGIDVRIATDPDEAGDRYADEIRAALPAHARWRRVDLRAPRPVPSRLSA